MEFILAAVVTFLMTLLHNSFIKLVVVFVMLDTVFGLARAIREHKFNSCFGIDGAIRKILMIISVVALAVVDKLIGFNMLPFVPEEIIGHIGITKLGICEFFCLLYIMYEAVSILKNMSLCGMPMPKGARSKLENWLNTMTGEMQEIKKEDKTNEKDITDSGSR